MYRKLSVNITDSFIARNVVGEDDREIYEYSLEVFLSDFVYFTVAALSAMFSGSVLQSLIFFSGFFLIRKYAGGFHADTYTRCHFLFWLNQVLMIIAVKEISPKIQCWLSILFAVLSFILVLLFAPVDNENKPFTNEEKRKFRNRSRITVIIELIVIMTLYVINALNQYTFCLMLGSVSVSISLAAAKIKEYRKLKRLKC